MKIAVTGASGRIGNVVVRQLLEAGHKVRVLQRSESRALEGLTLERIPGDLFNRAALTQMAEGCEALVHLAALISMQGDMGGKVPQINVEGTRNVLETALENGLKRVVYFSSIHAFNQLPTEGIFDETRPLAFRSHIAYNRSKAEAMDLVHQFAARNNLEIVTLCPTGVIGPFDFEPSLSGQMLLDFYNQNIPLLVPGGFDWCDVRDVAAAAVSALYKGRSGEAYLLSGHYATLLQIAQMVGKVTSKPIPRYVAPNWMLRLGIPFVEIFSKITGKHPLYTSDMLDTLLEGPKHISSKKAQLELGYAARSLENSITDAYEWFEHNGYL